MATIAELVEKKEKLEAELSEVNAEIASRHGEDRTAPAAAEETAPKPKAPTKKT